MMTDATLADFGRKLREAYAGGAIEPSQPGSGPADVGQAYAVQFANALWWQAEGRRIAGRKNALTVEAGQRAFGTDQPCFGSLFDDRQLASGSTLDPACTIAPRVEGEVALVLARDVDAPLLTLEDAAEAVARVHAAIEIVDSRIRNWQPSLLDLIADNSCASHFILSEESAPVEGTDLLDCAMILRINGAVASSGTGAAALGHPLRSLMWLSAECARRGESLRTGEVILTGTLGPAIPITAGDKVDVTIEGIGACDFRFAQSA